ncbi:hypothetical protein ZEAMMB73_Zm00001d042751 [Zea mays]|jgi:hypothetical protein|uniref:Uncharacterized protein n=1 Tax=Zea mays TaxID=4577 RepID=A0A1D6N6J6_MAIZE|nr:hypothetical protein ZEAMMB73_Zm00001d042751 [Zea mays]
MGDAGFALLVALAAALAALFLVLLGAAVLRHYCWRRRLDAVAPPRRGFVLFDVCFADDRQQRHAVRPPPPSVERGWARRAAGEGRVEHAPGGGGEAAADDDPVVEPDELEIARWRKIFRGPNRSMSTIDEGTEKDGTTPAFSTPSASPDRRDARAPALGMETVAVQLRQA